ncbi:Predicted metal-dependent enzyme of the double-stranded beta helix superfamily [Amycolatopsis arida]|uniref:Predicted metal-dependent enzyme of the double-stranded beta helix superfamily n=1 Tax=Amycolatopsis arida TaxID=587909 RepID=A0A1I5NSF1_9PSEU|nr:cysteine dioxygenase family protein [Amycolatopsis arida]TDX98227.1 putative metal-dependent enzyme (double-stranded beta helix superfamily) [Amycolatopsis arida]SFP24703.1 Predicted metal-dependent enzyme of the double-stranded beta helix superfamily [Amycolatopsis arida]
MFAVPANTVAVAENPALRHPVRVALAHAADRASWAHLLRYDPERRFAVLVSRTEAGEVWLMSWLPGQGTGLHDHGRVDGAFTVVSGELSELVVRRTTEGRVRESRRVLAAGQSRVFGPGYVHEVRNDGVDPAVSLHVYRAGGRTLRPYALDPLDGPVPR